MTATVSKFDVKDLDLWYGQTQALKKVALNVEPNSITALIGPSGCGKSTFIRVLDRMNDLIESVRVEGTVLYDGEDIFGDYDVIELRKKVGMVFQKPNPFPMSVYDNVAYGPRVHGLGAKASGTKARRALDEIVERSLVQAALFDEVKDRLHKSALGLSGGQQQRLCIARVLAVEPDVLLMDEPTSALDPISTAKIEALLDDLKKRYTIIIVTHNMQQAGRVSDRTGFFLNGELVEYGSTKDIFFNPRDQRTENYISGRFG
jgi:phosphate transport system ATP-binding protein